MTNDDTVSHLADPIIAEYLRAVDRGEVPDRAALLAAHPAVADELRAFFANADQVTAHAAGVRGGPPIGTALKYVGDYELLGEIARGGMGVVYRARQVSLNRLVALKMVLAGDFAAPSVRERFRLEVEAVARLEHPNIVSVYEFGEHQQQPYFSMRLIESGGRSLDEYRLPARASRAAQQKLAQFLAELARAVHYAHQRGIIHRDLKPANILVDSAGRPHVSDFGLAKSNTSPDLTASGTVLGTPAYMAPEQAVQAKDATTQSDVYSLGAILYALLTGQAPFVADSVLETLRQVRAEPVVPPTRHNASIDRDLEAICLKCLAKAPAERYETAEALALDLERWTNGEAISIQPASAVRLVWQWLRRNIRTAGWVSAVGLIGGTLSSLALAYASIDLVVTNALKTYTHFPSVPVPTVLLIYQAVFAPLRWLPFGQFVWLLLGGLIGLSLGAVVVMLTKPRNVLEDLKIGVGTGLMAALPALFLCIGPAVVLALVVVPQLSERLDLVHCAFATEQAPQSRANLDGRYPDLANLPNDRKRADYLFGLHTAEMVAGTYAAQWVGLGLVLVFGLVIVVAQAIGAGVLLRREGTWRRAWLGYIETSLAWLNVGFGLLFLFGQLGNGEAATLETWHVFAVLLPAAALFGVFWRFPFFERWAVYLVLFLLVGEFDFLRFALGLFAAGAVLMWLTYRLRTQRAS
jgi:hypothetical protein